MSKNESHLFTGTKGAKVTEHSISKYRERFLGKTATQIERMLQKRGYKTTIRSSIHSGSKAKIIVIGNSSADRNITQVQVSPGSKRHGNVPYIKISTNDIGIHKVIDASPSEYQSDKTEKAKLWFRRYH